MIPIRAVRVHIACVAMLAVCALAGPVQADEWSFIFMPQVWLSNIPFNGFGAVGSASGGAPTFLGRGTPFGVLFVPGRVVTPNDIFVGQIAFPANAQTPGHTEPQAPLYPQWGGQVAAQNGPWTMSVAAQYVSLETRTELFTTGGVVPCNIFLSASDPAVQGVCTVPANRRIATEGINTDRVDVDLALTYFVPDVIRDVMDVSFGVGFKWIRASGQRTLESNASDLLGPQGGIVYTLHGGGARFSTKASFLDNFYGVTLPMTATFQLSANNRWFLPVTLIPYIGYEERQDQVRGFERSFVRGATLDAGIRYVFDNGMALYGGYRGQVIDGNNLYVAHGPLFNLSVRFGGK